MANQLYIRQLHTLPTMVWQIVDEEGCPIDLADTVLGEAQKVTFTFAKSDRAMTPVLIETPASFLDKTKGLLEYKWTKYDTLYCGFYYAMFTVYFASSVNQGEKAKVDYEGVTYEAADIGEDLNSVDIVFDGVKTIAQIVSDFNTAYPDDNITHNAADDSVVPTAGTVTLSGGSNTITLEKKIGYPSQREDLEVKVTKIYGSASDFPPDVPESPDIEDWLADRKRTDFVPSEAKDGVNKVFSTLPYFFTVNEAFNIHVKFNGVNLVRGVDYNVASTDTNKLGYNQIIFESDFDAPEAIDSLLFDFYISDRE